MQINVLDYFEKGALLKCPGKVAVREQNGELTFADLERCAKNLAALILKRTSATTRPIPVFLPKSAESIVADLGILYSANAYANLNVKSPPQRLKGMLQNLDADVIVTSAALAPTLRALEIPDSKMLLIEPAMSPHKDYDNDLLL